MIRLTCPNCGRKTEPDELVHGRCCPECNAMILQTGGVYFAEPEEAEEAAEEAAVAGDAGGDDGAGEAEGAAEGVAGSEADDR